MSHAAGTCPGWHSGIYTADQCRPCWRSENPATRTDRPAVVTGAELLGVPVGIGVRVATIRGEASRIPLECVHLGDIIKRCSRGDTHRCNFDGHNWQQCTPSPNIPDALTRSCINCPNRDAGLEGDQLMAEIAGPEKERTDPRSWCQSPAVQTAHTLAYRRFLADLPAFQSDGAGRGYIVIGGGKYAAGVYLSIRMLREVGSDLPVQVWHRGQAEPVPACVRELPGVTVIDAEAHPARSSWRVLGGWQLKMIAGLWSGWREWIFSDADNYPVVDPAPLFDNSTGAVLWPDLEMNDGGCKWASYGVMPPTPNRGTNGGSAVFDAARCWRALWLAHWFDMHSEYYYKPEFGTGGYGDQDQVRAAFHITGTPYTLPAVRPENRGGIFLQKGLDGRVAFVHRIHDKPRPGGLTRHDAGIPRESDAHRIMGEYRD